MLDIYCSANNCEVRDFENVSLKVLRALTSCQRCSTRCSAHSRQACSCDGPAINLWLWAPFLCFLLLVVAAVIEAFSRERLRRVPRKKAAVIVILQFHTLTSADLHLHTFTSADLHLHTLTSADLHLHTFTSAVLHLHPHTC